MWQTAKALAEKKDRPCTYVCEQLHFCGVAVTSCCNLDHNYSMSEFKEGKEIHLLETKLENLSDVLRVSRSSFYKESQMLTKRPWFSGRLRPTKICDAILYYTEKFLQYSSTVIACSSVSAALWVWWHILLWADEDCLLVGSLSMFRVLPSPHSKLRSALYRHRNHELRSFRFYTQRRGELERHLGFPALPYLLCSLLNTQKGTTVIPR